MPIGAMLLGTLESGGESIYLWRIHEDDGEFDYYNRYYGCKGRFEVGEEERQGVADAAQSGHQSANATAHPGMFAAGQASVIALSSRRFRKRRRLSLIVAISSLSRVTLDLIEFGRRARAR
jgi:hypothetical protein